MIRNLFSILEKLVVSKIFRVKVEDSNSYIKQIDELNRQIHRELFSYMAENPESISESLSLLWVAKALERIGDHASNIAERAVFYIEGIDIRHMGCDE